MEFNYHAPHPLSTITYVSEGALRGVFPANVPGLPVQVNSVEAQIRRELEKEEIRREILAGEMARRRVLEEEVRREIASERAEGFLFLVRQLVSMPSNNPIMIMRMNPVNHIHIYGGPQPQLPPQIDIRQPFTQLHTIKDKEIILARPDADLSGAKRKAETPSAVVDSEPAPLQKKPKQEWSCSLCHVAATSEKGLHDHLVGKKHNSKEASLRTPTIGLDPRPARQILKPSIRPANKILQPLIAHADTGVVLESGKENQAVQKSQVSENENKETGNETATGEAKALPFTRKFRFWCALCEFETRLEPEMHNHKMEEKHLANVKKCGGNWRSSGNWCGDASFG